MVDFMVQGTWIFRNSGLYRQVIKALQKDSKWVQRFIRQSEKIYLTEEQFTQWAKKAAMLPPSLRTGTMRLRSVLVSMA